MRFTDIFREIQALLPSSRYQIHLFRHEREFIIQSFKNSQPVALSQIVGKTRLLSGIQEILPLTRPTTFVPPDRLSQVRQLLGSISDPLIQVTITPEIENLRYVSAPSDFLIRFLWNGDLGCIENRPDYGAIYLGAGWFLTEGAYWLNRNLNSTDDQWLQRQRIEGKELIEFLTTYLHELNNRKTPLLCPVSYSDEPVCEFDIGRVAIDSVEITLNWKEAPGLVQKVPSLDRYVFVNNTVRPGMIPQELCQNLPAKGGQFRLLGQQIPIFLWDNWRNLSGWACGQVDQLLREHKILTDKTELILSVKQTEMNGIGCPFAIPTFICNDQHVGAFELLSKIDAETEFVRTESAWVPVESLRKAQVDYLGRTYQASSLKPVALTPSQLFSVKSKTPAGPWKRVEFESFQLPYGKSSQELAISHLEFLRYWGIPGGLVSSQAIYGEAFAQMFNALLNRLPTARILMVGTKTALDSMASCEWQREPIRLEGSRSDKTFDPEQTSIVLATPKALETIPQLLAAQWNISCLLEADTLIKSSNSKLYTNLLAYRRHLAIGQFAGTSWLQRTSTRDALSSVFNAMGATIDPRVWSYSLCELENISPSRPTALPDAGHPIQSDSSIELVIKASANSAGLQVPPKRENTGPVIIKAASGIDTPRIQVTYSTSADEFVHDARKWANRSEPSAQFVPFVCYWPTYAAMSTDQTRWYFHWRGEVRQGRYLDTDLSYVFVLIYELLNGIGAKDAIQGYEQLRQIWLNYRDRYPKLDGYLVEWITDYVLVNNCAVDKLHIYRQALKLGVSFVNSDLLLSECLNHSLAKLPINLLEKMTNYRITKSKFYLEGHQGLMADYIPQAIERVNAEMLKRSGDGIFEIFNPGGSEVISREPFRSAVYKGNRFKITIGTVTPYSRHQPLRDFLTSVVKHSENCLRSLKDYKGRLRGYTLEETTRDIIDRFILGASAFINPAKPRAKVIIDLSKVKTLTEESDEVRSMLINTAEQADLAPAEKNESLTDTGVIQRPPGTPDHLLTDLNEVYSILQMLDNNEHRVIQVIMDKEWKMADTELRAAFPDILIEPLIDHINDLALKNVGDLLIADEIGSKVITDDLRDEIEYLYRTQVITPDARRTVLRVEGLPEDWADFAARLNHTHLSILQILFGGEQVIAELRNVAEANATMPEQLIDEINELALETIGDIIIESSANPPVIEDEDFAMVKELLAAKMKG